MSETKFTRVRVINQYENAGAGVSFYQNQIVDVPTKQLVQFMKDGLLCIPEGLVLPEPSESADLREIPLWALL